MIIHYHYFSIILDLTHYAESLSVPWKCHQFNKYFLQNFLLKNWIIKVLTYAKNIFYRIDSSSGDHITVNHHVVGIRFVLLHYYEIFISKNENRSVTNSSWMAICSTSLLQMSSVSNVGYFHHSEKICLIYFFFSLMFLIDIHFIFSTIFYNPPFL